MKEIINKIESIEYHLHNMKIIVGSYGGFDLIDSNITELKALVKNCSMPDVIDQSEKLPCAECSGNGGGVTDDGWEKCDCQK